MKTNKIFIAFALALLAVVACEPKLPYDLAGTEHGVVINISKVIGSSTTLSTDMNDGNYQVKLALIDQQGDASMLKEAQLMAVYTDGAKNKKSAKIITGITQFPYTAKIDIKDACSKLGISKIEIGDRIDLTPCVTLKSGTQVDGWSELTGFNNTLFTGWPQESGSFAYRVSYTAFAPFHKEKFQGDALPWEDSNGASGTCKIIQKDMSNEANMPPAKNTPSGVTANDLVGLRVEGPFWWEMPDEGLDMWINTQDFTLIIPDQVMSASFEYPGMGDAGKVGNAEDCEGEVDTLNDDLIFYYVPTFGAGYWWGVGFTVTVHCK